MGHPARIIHPDSPGHRFMVVLTYKFDESYKDARSLMVGGWIGEEEQWRTVQNQWGAAIAYENQTLPENRKISRYHASEMNARDHEFQGWENERMVRLTKSLLEIVGKSGMTAVTCGVDLAAFLSIFPHRDPPDYGVAYGMCMKQLMLKIAEAMEHWEPDYRVALVHDHGDWDKLAYDGFYQLVDDPKWEHRERFVSITPLSSYADIGLQAADLIAYEAMRQLDDTLWTGDDMRVPLRELLKKTDDVYGFYFTRSYLEKFKQLVMPTP
jgi:hypothetical protein